MRRNLVFSKIRKWLLGEQTVYKITYGAVQRRSCVARGIAQVAYEEGQWVCAPAWLDRRGYWLTCFDTLDHAFAFASTYGRVRGSYQLWKCSANKVKRWLPPLCVSHELGVGCRVIATHQTWPDGTLMAKRLKLDKFIPWPEKYP